MARYPHILGVVSVILEVEGTKKIKIWGLSFGPKAVVVLRVLKKINIGQPMTDRSPLFKLSNSFLTLQILQSPTVLSSHCYLAPRLYIASYASSF